MKMGILPFVFLCCVQLCVAQDGPVVDTTYGPVQGESVGLENGNVIDSYLGIPYARAPVDELRFAPPQPPAPWEEVFMATDLGNACHQPMRNRSVWSQNAEDCLNLNIYSKQGNDKAAVMVWIHGGSFQTGAGFLNPGYFLADKDVVLVTINYRMGILGFASSMDEVLPGNMGLLDQIQALQFVQDNIEAFGGDPQRVTVFGQSAGGASIGLLESAPQAEGLFHGAILQSGTGVAPWAVHRNNTDPESYLEQVAASYNCNTANSQAILDCLRQVEDAQELTLTEFNCTVGTTSCMGFIPVIDGSVVADLPLRLRAEGRFMQIPELVGLTSEDGFDYCPDYIADGATEEEFELYFQSLGLYLSALWPEPGRRQIYTEAETWFRTAWPDKDPETNRKMIGEAITDHSFGAGANLHAKSSAENMPVYFYVYKYLPENEPVDWRGTIHSDDLAMVFGRPFLWDNPEALNHSQIELDDTVYTQYDRQYSDFIMTLWTNFAKYGNPTPEPVGPSEDATIEWSPFQSGNLTYAFLDSTPVTGKDYREKEYAYYNHYLAYLIYGREFFLD